MPTNASPLPFPFVPVVPASRPASQSHAALAPTPSLTPAKPSTPATASVISPPDAPSSSDTSDNPPRRASGKSGKSGVTSGNTEASKSRVPHRSVSFGARQTPVMSPDSGLADLRIDVVRAVACADVPLLGAIVR